MKIVLGWIAVAGSVGVGIALLVTRLMGETYSSITYIRAGIILPIVLLYGLRLLRKPKEANNASPGG